MKKKVDATHHLEYELGRSFGKALRQILFTDTKVRQALLLDVLGDDRTLLAPLRHLVEAPNFPELMNEPVAAARNARKDALLNELSSWCNDKTLGRLEAFLSGTLDPASSDNANGFPDQEAASPTARDSRVVDQNTDPWHPREPATSANPPAAASTKPDSAVYFASQSIVSLSETALAASLTGDHHRAIELLSEALRLDPAKPDLYMQRGCLHAKNQDPGSAIQDFTSVLRLEPNNHEARAQRGQAHALMGATEKAVEDWQSAASAGHRQAKQWYSKSLLETGKDLLMSGKEEDAIRVLGQAIRLSPADPDLYYLRGQANQEIAELCYLRLRRDQASVYHGFAISDFTSAIRLDPGHASALALRGKSYKAKSDLESALIDWKRASDLGSQEAAKWLKDLQSEAA